MYYVYILKTSSDTLYTGYTVDIEKRLKEHRSKTAKGAKYTRSFSTLELVYSERFNTRSEAMKREAEIKKLKRKDKLALISSTFGTEWTGYK